jgi:hypothetical protein
VDAGLVRWLVPLSIEESSTLPYQLLKFWIKEMEGVF